MRESEVNLEDLSRKLNRSDREKRALAAYAQTVMQLDPLMVSDQVRIIRALVVLFEVPVKDL